MAARRPSSDTVPSCPFCSYTAPSHSETDIYMLYQHVELSHNDQESPFMETEPGPIRGGPSSRSRSRSNSGRNRLESSPSPDDDVYVDCPLRCGEAVHIRELDNHMDLHEIESLSLDEIDKSPGPAYGSRHASPRPSSGRARTPSYDFDFSPPNQSRAGFLLVPDSKASGKQLSKAATLGGIKDFVLGPAAKKNRPIESDSKSGTIKRLGVCCSMLLDSTY